MKFKKFISLLASLAMAVTAVTGAMTASASEVANGTCGDLTWTLDSDGKLTISGEGEMASPEVKDLEPVEQQLGEYSNIYTYKEYKNDIKEVVIGEGVTAIGFCAFYKMSSIEKAVLPSTISQFKGIGISLTEGEPSRPPIIEEYASYAFAECTSLKNLTLEDGMGAIGNHSFYGCTSLESVIIPSTITDVEIRDLNNKNWGADSFNGCTKLKYITLPEGLTVIGARAFANTAVESVVIPSTIKTWNYASDPSFTKADIRRGTNVNLAFANCKNLLSVTFKEGLDRIGYSPFYNCPKLTRISIPKSITGLYRAFAYCDGLEEAYIEDGAQIVGRTNDNDCFDYAFYYCQNLKKLEIPEGVEIAYTNAQWCKGCSSLEEVYIHSKSSGVYMIPVNSKIKFYVYNDSQAYADLSKDISTFNKIYDISEAISKAHVELNKAVNEAKAYTEDKYTAESYGALKTALENAKKYDENYTGVMAMQWAAEDISNAINSLVKKPAQDSVKPGTTKPSTTMPNVKSQAQKNAENAMKQAKITKLTVKSKAKKKITVTWKKVQRQLEKQVQ